ncbi:MAG: molecular chaperone TorD family protein [Syntrophaceae bacterium]|nr:molecular chaperone TorD family protein [Syntrophaceae bacterium]
MFREEKESVSRILSCLLSSPDEGMAEEIYRGTLYSFFRPQVQSWGGEIGILKGFRDGEAPEVLSKNLKKEYDRLFSDFGSEKISLVESFYKPWTQDPDCSLSFAAEKGLIMGDSALHLSALYQKCGLEIGEGFQGMPDHLILELEFLGYLYRWASDREIKMFIKDHLDWIPLLKVELERASAHPFYRTVLEVLDLFLRTERRRLEKESDGEEKIC